MLANLVRVVTEDHVDVAKNVSVCSEHIEHMASIWILFNLHPWVPHDITAESFTVSL